MLGAGCQWATLLRERGRVVRGDRCLGKPDPAIAQRAAGAWAATGSAAFPVLSLPTFPKGKRGKSADSRDRAGCTAAREIG
jgi:hypothetical protein